MNYAQLFLRKPSSFPPPLPSGYGLPGFNIGPSAPYLSIYPMTDLAHHTDERWNTEVLSYINADGWLTAVPSGITATVTIAYAMGSQAYIKPGTYRLKLKTANGCIVSADGGSFVTGGAATANQTTFTITQSNIGNQAINVHVQNNTGSSKDIEFTVVHTDYVSAFDAGTAEFHPEFIATLQGSKLIRGMDLMETNFSAINKVSDLVRDTARNKFSVEKCVRLAAKLNCPLHMCYPEIRDALWLSTTAGSSTIKSVDSYYNGTTSLPVLNHGFTTNDQVITFSYANNPPGNLTHGTLYYVTVLSPTTFYLSSTIGGAAITISTTTIPSTSDYTQISRTNINSDVVHLAIAQRMYAANPGLQQVAEYANEVWNIGFSAHSTCQYIKSRLAGAPLDWTAGYAWASLKLWNVIESVFPAAQVTRLLNFQNGADVSFQSLDWVDTGVQQAGKKLWELMPNGSVAVAPYISMTSTPYDPSLMFQPTLSLQQSFQLNNRVPTFAEFDTLYNNAISWQNYYLAYSLTKLRQRSATISFTTYEAGLGDFEYYYAKTITDAQYLAMGNQLFAYKRSSNFVAVLANYRAGMVASNVRNFMQFFHCGAWAVSANGSTGGFSGWGLSPCEDPAQQTPASIAFLAYT